MSFKTSSSFLAAHYPNTYMEQFCKALHPDFELGTTCVEWFRQAMKHCTDLLNDAKAPTSLWTTLRKFIFPDRSTELISQKISININPTHLTIHDCQTLIMDIVSDYVQRAPRYAAESKTNAMLWQVLYSLMGIMTLGSLLVGVIFVYNKYGRVKLKLNILEELFKPEKRMQAFSKRSLRLAKAEMRNIHIKREPKAKEFVPTDGAALFTIKVGKKKQDFLDSVVVGSLPSVGKFHRLYDQYSKTKADFKVESMKKAMRFLDNNCNKLHLLIMLEEDVNHEEEIANSKRKSNSPRIKSMSPPSSKRMVRPGLEGGDFTKKTVTGNISGSPRKRITTPRSSENANTGIPRNVCERSPLAKKTK